MAPVSFPDPASPEGQAWAAAGPAPGRRPGVVHVPRRLLPAARAPHPGHPGHRPRRRRPRPRVPARPRRPGRQLRPRPARLTPVATRDELVNQPRSGVREGAARGGPVTPPPPASSPAGQAAKASASRRRRAGGPGRPPPPPASASPARKPPGTPPRAGPASPARPAAAPGAGPRGKAPRASTASAEGAGGLLALFAYPVLMNLLRGGPAQARGWFAAKFFNEPYNPPGPARSTGTHTRKGTTTAGGRG